MRKPPISVVVKTPEEIKIEMEDANATPQDINSTLDEMDAREKALQAKYDTKTSAPFPSAVKPE